MNENRREQLLANLENETADPRTQAWREELTAEELDFVAQIDDQYCRGVSDLCTAILIRDRLRERFHPGDLQEVETIQDHCRLRLRDGRLLLARLARDGSLRLTEINEVC